MPSTETVEETDIDLDFPSMWGVAFLNDDYTPMDFVKFVLMNFFSQPDAVAEQIVLAIHNKGQEIVGCYTKDVAMTKATLAENCAKGYGHPLRMVPTQL